MILGLLLISQVLIDSTVSLKIGDWTYRLLEPMVGPSWSVVIGQMLPKLVIFLVLGAVASQVVVSDNRLLWALGFGVAYVGYEFLYARVLSLTDYEQIANRAAYYIEWSFPAPFALIGAWLAERVFAHGPNKSQQKERR